jgi:hypothetical protein
VACHQDLVLGQSDQKASPPTRSRLSRTLVFLGLQALPLSLAPIGFPGIALQTSMDTLHVTVAGTMGIARGYAETDLSLQLLPTGVQVFAQWLWLDPLRLTVHGSTIGHAFCAQ